MASFLYNRGKRIIMDGVLDFAADAVSVLLVDENHTPNIDHNTVSQVVADELSGTGYSRKALANKSVTQNNTDDRAEWDADDVLWTEIDAGQAKAAILFRNEEATDAARDLIAYIDTGGFPVTTTGADLEIAWHANGILHGIDVAP